MPFLHFSKEQLHNPDFSFMREILQANNTGAYCSSTLANCNTRKYHGLLVVQQPLLDDNRYVLLSALDESILHGEKKIQLGTHRYPDIYHPEGYYRLEEFTYERAPKWLIQAEGICLKKEILLVKNEERVLIRYTVIESKAPFQLQFDPFLSFRSIHEVSKCNINAVRKSEKIKNGVKCKMYAGFSDLFIQFSKKPEFVASPDWHFNNEYSRERERGYEYREDLYCPGYFKIALRKGEQLVFSAGLSEIGPRKLKTLFDTELSERPRLNDFKSCLMNAAQQFFVKNKEGVSITAGFHWFGQWGRDTFIALPGLTLSTGQPKVCKAVLDTMLKDLKKGLFPNAGTGKHASYNTADASLWFFWALQQYAMHTSTMSEIWNEYGARMKSILEHYRKGTWHNIHMQENGLLYAGETGLAVTWMDALVDGKAVTPRIGLAVELNALWYNAIRFSLEVAELALDDKFISEWQAIPPQIEISFKQVFWSKEKKYLADYANHDYTDWSLRPNQVIAASLPYSPATEEMKKSLLEIVKAKLLTPRGLRTLSPEDKHYKGTYVGNHRERDLAYHQGTVWPWLLGHFAEACLKAYGEGAMSVVQSIYENFAPAILEYGIGTVAEIYEGDDPHRARGAVSQAWSVAELLRIRSMITANHKDRISELKKKEALQPA